MVEAATGWGTLADSAAVELPLDADEATAFLVSLTDLCASYEQPSEVQDSTLDAALRHAADVLSDTVDDAGIPTDLKARCFGALGHALSAMCCEPGRQIEALAVFWDLAIPWGGLGPAVPSTLSAAMLGAIEQTLESDNSRCQGASLVGLYNLDTGEARAIAARFRDATNHPDLAASAERVLKRLLP